MSDAGEISNASAQQFDCPGCQEGVEVAGESVGKLVRCPYCNTDFFASIEQSHLLVVDDTLSVAKELDRESAFNQLRIEQLTALRMGAIRSRSWWMIGFCMAVLTAVNLAAKAGIYFVVLGHFGWTPATELLAAGLTIFFGRHAWRRAAVFKREIDQSALAEPSVPPDFSTLSNGSDRWKNLENVR